jgi:regulation of enolase protein 1 (concanavalin A-like superfamily)
MARRNLPSWRRLRHVPRHMGKRIPWWKHSRVAVALVALLVAGLLPPLGASAQTTPAFPSDDFNRTALGSPWTVTDPAGDGSAVMSGAGTGDARLELSVPGGSAHEPWNTNGALRAMRPAANTDFVAQARFQSVPTQRYQMQGILVQQDADDWLRFEIHHNGTSVRAFAAVTVAGVSTKKFDKPAATGAELYLRVTRTGGTWALATSGDGTTWTTAGSFTQGSTVSAVGVYAGNAGTAPPAYTALVDYLFEMSAPISPEDGTAPDGFTLTTNASGPGAVTRSPDKATYQAGEAVTLTAVPDAGATFTGWSGGASGGANPTVVTINADTSVTAGFAAGSGPVISGVNVAPSGTSAVVTWATDVNSTSSVAVGPTTAYELGSFGSATMVTSHSVTVTGLSPGTTYHYRVSSTNGGGQSTTGADATFTTTSSSPAGLFTSDDFNRTTLGAPWTVVDPVGDGTVSLSGAGTQDARLQLAVPAGTSHDPWNDNRSLRVMQPTTDVDFAAELKFDSAPTQKYQIEGLLVQQDADDWLRFNLHHNGTSLRAYAAATVAGTSTKKLETSVPSASSLWMRVTRAGDTWTLATSTTGTSWTTIGSFAQALDATAIGPFAGNAGSPVPAWAAKVDYVFDVAAPVVPEDTSVPAVQRTLTTSASGSGSVTRSPDKATYDDGEQVTLTAVPGAGASFAGWSGALSGGANPAQLTMNADKSVTATFVTDTTPPVISNVSVSPSSTSAVVTWTTNEPATSSVAVGPTTAYGSTFGSSALRQDHSVTLTGLAPATTYHYAVSSTDGVGLTATRPDATFATPASSGPVIDVWYGNNQTVGAHGRPQAWVNLLGNVSDPDGVAALSYTLNGGASTALSQGPDNRRLEYAGDFNAELAYSDLSVGDNAVRITARDGLNNITTRDVVITRVNGSASLPYTTNWGTATKVNDQAQVVDGKWGIDGGMAHIQAMGYDRIIDIGDVSWHDYEMTVPVRVDGLGPRNGAFLSGNSLVGFGLNWRGHTNTGSTQPGYYWYPTGALGWYRWYEPTPKFELRGNGDSPIQRHNRFQLEFGTTYMFKARSDTVSGGVEYSWKVWPQGSAEPAAWDLQITEPDGPATGSLILIAHHSDVRFGNVTVTSLP